MRHRKRNTLSLLAGAACLCVAQLHAADNTAETQKTSIVPAAFTTSNPLTLAYIPPAPLRPTPVTRVDSGGTRGDDLPLPTVTLLVPEHVAHTISEQPELYWHVSGPTQHPVTVTLTSVDGVKPVLELKLEPVAQSGIHVLRLADHGVGLQIGEIYEWSVRIGTLPDKTTPADAVARAFIERQAVPMELDTDEADALRRAAAYAGNAIWYEAFAELFGSGDTDDQQLRTARASLLSQVGLDETALAQ